MESICHIESVRSGTSAHTFQSPSSSHLSKAQTVGLAPGIYLGALATLSNTRTVQLLGTQCGPPSSKDSANVTSVCPRETQAGSRCPGVPPGSMGTAPSAPALSGRERWEAPGLAMGVTSFVITCRHRRPRRLSGHPGRLPPGFCCICLDSEPLREPSFSTLFKVRGACPSNAGLWRHKEP